jgi:chaperonin GroES
LVFVVCSRLQCEQRDLGVGSLEEVLTALHSFHRGPRIDDQKLVEAYNIMNIRPLYDRILVKRIEEQETMRNGIVIPDSAKEKPQEGEVIALGHGKRLDNGELVALDVQVGDRILFGKYSGSETKLDGTEYIIMREDDVLGVLSSGAKSAKSAG